jgi:hypothetical protein
LVDDSIYANFDPNNTLCFGSKMLSSSGETTLVSPENESSMPSYSKGNNYSFSFFPVGLSIPEHKI